MNGKKLFGIVAENWPAKALSLALAIALYIFHSMSILEERFFSVPLNIETDNNMVPASSYPQMVRVSLKGDSGILFPIMDGDVEAYLDLGKYDVPGTYRVEILVRKKGTAVSIEPLEIRVDPVDIELSLDYKISKFVPITANMRGNVEPGYFLTSWSINPYRIIIDGPAGHVSAVSELTTDYIDLEGRSEDFSVTVNLHNGNPFTSIRGGETAEFHALIRRIGYIEERQ